MESLDCGPLYIRPKAAPASPANAQAIVASPDDPRLPRGAIDTVFICDVLHHIGNRPAYYAKLRSGLKRGGRIVIVDFHKRQESSGPPLAMRLADTEVIAELRKGSWPTRAQLAQSTAVVLVVVAIVSVYLAILDSIFRRVVDAIF